MQVQRVDNFDEFKSLKSDWDALYAADPESQFFLSWSWLAGVFETYPNQWTVLIARTPDGELRGVLPLRRTTLWSHSQQQLRHEIEFAGRLFWADYGGILCHSEHEPDVLQSLAGFLKQMNWSNSYFKGFHISERRFAYYMGPFVDENLSIEFHDMMINGGTTDNLVCPYIELPASHEEYLNEKLSGNARQKARRLFRQLESSPELRITLSNSETRSGDLEALEKFWFDMWLPKKESDTRRLASKYAMIAKRGLEDELVHMPILWQGEKRISMLVSFVDRIKSQLLFFLTGRDESFNQLPVGLLLHHYSIRWAIENGLRYYDLLRGNEQYKYSLGARDCRIKYVSVNRRSGANLDRVLDSEGIRDAIRLTEDFLSEGSRDKARIVCQQILATQPDQESAMRILSALDEC